MTTLEARLYKTITTIQKAKLLKKKLYKNHEHTDNTKYTKEPVYTGGNTSCHPSTEGHGIKCSFCSTGKQPVSFKNKKQDKKKLEDLRWDCYDISDEIIDILIKKHNDYGPNNIAKAPGGAVNGLAVRLHDKIERLNHLISNGKEPSNESIRDTFIDIANYGIIGLLVLDNKWDN